MASAKKQPSDSLTEEQKQAARRKFDQFDADHSGTISFSEMKALLEDSLCRPISQKLYEKYVSVEFHRTDLNQDLQIQFEEFLNLYARLYTSAELPIAMGYRQMPSRPAAQPTAQPSEAPKMMIPKGIELTEEQKSEAWAKFNKFDADHSGSIDRAELRTLLEEMQKKKMSDLMWKRYVDMHMSSVDKDGSGTIDFNEFLVLYAKLFAQEGQAPQPGRMLI